MSSEDVAKTVGKKLKFYVDTQRREDAFDLSGPYHPEKHPPPLRTGSSLAYDGLHDRSLKHYYRNKKIKQQLQNMNTPEMLSLREKQIKKKIDKTMQEYNYKPVVTSPYAVPLIQPMSQNQVPDIHYKPKRGSRRRKNPHVYVGKTPRIGRRAPDERIPVKEKQRLVNMATKLIVATETVALPRSRRSEKDFPSDANERLPRMHDMQIERRASSASDPGPRMAPRPPEFQNGARRKTKPTKWDDSNSGEVSLDSTLDSIRSQMRHINIDMRGDSYLVSSDKKEKSPRREQEAKASSPISKQRPKSAGDQLSQNQDEFDYEDDFYDEIPDASSPVYSPRTAWKAGSPAQSIVSSTQTVESRGTQTTKDTTTGDENPERFHGFVDKSHSTSLEKLRRPKSASTGTQVEPSFMHEDVKRRDVEKRVVSYEIFVVTGDKLGAGTSSDVKICLFGSFGDSGERPLLRSKTNKNPFERKQNEDESEIEDEPPTCPANMEVDKVDVFNVDSIYLGDLNIVRIGHNGTALGSGWFLDRIVVRDGENATEAFEFKCGRWLSARDDDGQIVRDLPLSSILPGNEVPQVSTTNRAYFKYRPDSASSTGSGKIKFRPLSASMGRQKEVEPDRRTVNEVNETDSNDQKKEDDSVKTVTTEDVAESNKRRQKKPKETKSKNSSKEKLKKPETELEMETKKGSDTDVIRSEVNVDEESESKDEHALQNSTDDDKKLDSINVEDDDSKVEEHSKTETEGKDSAGTAEERDNENEDSVSSKSSEDSDSSSDASDIFSVSGTDSESSDSEDESENPNASDNDEKVERIEKDTSKKEESNEKERKKSIENDFMAGFLAGVQASKADIHHDEVKQDTAVTKGPNIHQASENGDFARIKELVDEIPELKHKPDERGWTPLHIVAAFGHLEILKWLSVNGVNLTKETPTGFSAIHLAAMNGHVKCIMVLAAMGCPLSCRTVDESTPLHLAAMSGHVECVKWLLANRANSSLKDINGRTPLDLADEYQHEECAKILRLLEREMRRKDSVITMLRHPGGKDIESSEANTDSSRGADSGVGGVESGDDAWISDAEDEVIGRSDRPSSGINRKDSFGAKARKKSKQDEKAQEELEEKRKNYEKQQKKMQRRESSFLDSIRQDIDDKSDNDF